MYSEKDVLLIGNGINYLSKNSLSWKSILKQLANDIYHEEIIKLIDEKPFTLVYEEIVFKSKSVSEIEIKRKVSELVNQINSNDYHRQILKSRFKHIITTNYDYTLERSINSKINNRNLKKETKYSLFRRKEINGKYIWHIHGESSAPNSILLGHEQYSGQLQKMRSYATSKATASRDISQFMQNNLTFDEDGSIYSWLDVFLRDNVHILGLSLDYTEIDLWWLLSYRERILKKKDYNVGKIYFHTITKSINKQKLGLLSILESFGVKNVEHDSYEIMYETVING